MIGRISANMDMENCNAKQTDRKSVEDAWPALTDEERREVCRTCESYFPTPPDGFGFECLAGHGTRYTKPCQSYRRTVFALVEDWEYTGLQVHMLRSFERECVRRAGEEWDDDDD